MKVEENCIMMGRECSKNGDKRNAYRSSVGKPEGRNH
jgi:hypothetical protein